MNATPPISVTSTGKHLLLPWRQDLATLIPHSRELQVDGHRILVVPNEPSEARLARNLGLMVPPPIMTRYDWNGHAAWDVQKRTAALLVDNARVYVLNQMGTGKTLSALLAFDWMKKQSIAKRMLVSAPLSTLTPVWAKEIWRYFPKLTFEILDGPRDRRLKRLAKRPDVSVINHHGMKVILKELYAEQFDVAVVDELAIFRNGRADLWKVANYLLPPIPFVWGMTGSPTPRAPSDAWAQVRLLTPGRVPKAFGAFRDRTMVRFSTFTWKPRPEAVNIVREVMQPSVRFSRDDVMELPETTYTERVVPLTPVAKLAYDSMVKKARMIATSGESITAVNEGVLHSKLLQVALGWVYTDKGQVFSIPNQPRLDALSEIIDECERKVIIFVPFIHALQGVVDYLVQDGHDVVRVDGSTPLGARNRIFTQFQSDPAGPSRLVAHPKCMAHGLTLTEADTIVWFSPTPDLEIYEQANARITRPGQKHKTLIAHLSATPVERLTYRKLQDRAKLQGILLDLFAQQEAGF